MDLPELKGAFAVVALREFVMTSGQVTTMSDVEESIGSLRSGARLEPRHLTKHLAHDDD